MRNSPIVYLGTRRNFRRPVNGPSSPNPNGLVSLSVRWHAAWIPSMRRGCGDATEALLVAARRILCALADRRSSPELDDAEARRDGECLQPRACPQLGDDVCHVRMLLLGGHAQPLGDLLAV